MNNSRLTKSGHVSIVGNLLLAEGKGTVHIEVHLANSADKVWSALTDPDHLIRWLGTFNGQLKIGGNFSAKFFASEWEGLGNIEVCEPQRLLRVSLVEAGAMDSHVMEVALTAHGEQTAVVVEERGIPPKQLAAYGAGVQVHVEDLVSHLSGGERCEAQARWKEIFPTYQSKSIQSA